MSGGSLVSPDSAMQVSAYYRGIIYISTQIAKLPINLKRSDNRQERNAIYRLLNKKPNSETNAFNFKANLVQTAISKGNAYAEIERNLSGDAVALWAIPDESVSLVRSPEGELIYKIVGGDRSTTYIPKEDILHIRNLHTREGIVGQGVVGYGRDILGIALGADKFANALYANSGIPSGTLKTPNKLSEEAYNRIRDSWKKQMGGKRTGNTAVLEEGLSYEAVTLDPEVLQFLETREFNVSEVARFLGLPPSKLYAKDSQKFNNVEETSLDVANDTLSVWAANISNEINNKLLNGRFGALESDFEMYDLFKADMDTRAQYFGKMMQVAAMTPNQIRLKEGMEPYEGGDRYFIATNNYSPMDRVDEIIDKQVSKEAPGIGSEGVSPDPSETNQGNVENKLEKVLTTYYESKIKK